MYGMKHWTTAAIVAICFFVAVKDGASDAVASPPQSTAAGAETLDDWRRTALGWERNSRWMRPPPVDRASYSDFVHPAAIACLQLLLSVGALIAAGRSSGSAITSRPGA
jgi:hypothetical protein